MITNIPTDLLRTLVAVVDLRSFTKAAQSLGVTQPAVSAHVKRLQLLLGTDLLDRATPGVVLTPAGEIVVHHARQLLSLNDEILHLAGGRRSAQTLRLGIPGDFAGAKIPAVLSKLRSRWPDVRFKVRHGVFEEMLVEMRQGEIDLVVGVAMVPPAFEARYMWMEDTVWVRGKETRLEPNAPVPLVSYSDRCPYYRTAVSALYNAGLKCEQVFNAASTLSLAAAVRAGLGVMAHTRSRMPTEELAVWDDAPLPKLAKVYGGIYLRDGSNREALEELADAIAAVLRPRETMTKKPFDVMPRVLLEAGE